MESSSRSAAPKDCETRKKREPVLYVVLPNRDSEIGIDRNQFQLIKKGGQYKRDKQVTGNGTQDELEIIQVIISDIPGNGHQRHGRNSRTNHPECHEEPGRLAVAVKKTVIPGMPGS